MQRKIRLTIYGLNGGKISLLHDYGDDAVIEIAADTDWDIHSVSVNSDVYTQLDNDTLTIENYCCPIKLGNSKKVWLEC